MTSQSAALVALFNQNGGGVPGRGALMYRLAYQNARNPLNSRPLIDPACNRTFVVSPNTGYLLRASDKLIHSLGEYPRRFGPVSNHRSAECPQ